jgi:hypothetical protein
MGERRALVVCALLATLAPACGSDRDSADSGSAVAGDVVVGACPPGPAIPGSECELEPGVGVRLEVRDRAGHEVAAGSSDEAGAFRIALAPGSYVLVPGDVPPPALEIGKPIEFEVSAGATTSLRVVLDTGIR